MNLTVTQQFPTDKECLEYIDANAVARWCRTLPYLWRRSYQPDHRKSTTKNVRRNLYQCLEATCKQHFSATSGTVFDDSHLPLHKWFMALAIVVDAKKSISANQLKEHLGIGSYGPHGIWHIASGKRWPKKPALLTNCEESWSWMKYTLGTSPSAAMVA